MKKTARQVVCVYIYLKTFILSDKYKMHEIQGHRQYHIILYIFISIGKCSMIDI